jgi:hypothetical protein
VKIINQSRKDTCLACVLAMMVNESEKYVLDWFGDLGTPKQDEDAFIFLAHHGIYLAMLADFTKITGEENEGISIDNRQTFTISFGLYSHRAYMVVDSPNKKVSHAVFWDGKNVLDPLHKEPQEIDGYKVQQIYPMMNSEKRMIGRNNQKER